MAGAHELTKLLQAVARRDWNAAVAAGAALADREEECGRVAHARALRTALRTQAHDHEASPETDAEAGWTGREAFLASALSGPTVRAHLDDLTLRPGLRSALNGLVAEHRHVDTLAKIGVNPRRKLLFHGPPGCGKSLAAVALGDALGLPVHVAHLDAVVGSFLGQTGTRLRELFRYATRVPCVLLLDEIDAVGRTRGSVRDLGEMDRVVIALMQDLEHCTPRGLIIATSNLPKQLDGALLRRFDDSFAFPRPTAAELEKFARQRAAHYGQRSAAAFVPLVARAPSFAEADRRVRAALREEALRAAGIRA